MDSNTKGALIGLATGLIVMVLQVFVIDQLLKRHVGQRERVLWTPLRCMYFKAIDDYCSHLLSVTYSWTKSLIFPRRLWTTFAS